MGTTLVPFPLTPDSSMVELPEARVFVVGSNPTLVVIEMGRTQW